MKKTITILLAFFFLGAIAQEMTEPKDPKETEQWTPVPAVVSVTNIPSDAIVLFDGKNLNEWVSSKDKSIAKWTLNKDGSMTVKAGTGDIQTKQKFGSIQLHLEWRSPSKVSGDGQGRGNSGLFFQNRYEVQILDNYNNKTYPNGQAGSIYKQYIPLVNACKKPGEWQTYDVIFHAPKFDKFGQIKKHSRFTVLHNGVLIQDHVKILGTSEYIGWPKNKPHGDDVIKLQDHGNHVSYRNIWVRKL